MISPDVKHSLRDGRVPLWS